MITLKLNYNIIIMYYYTLFKFYLSSKIYTMNKFFLLKSSNNLIINRRELRVLLNNNKI